VTVVSVTLSLNNLGFKGKLRHHYIYFDELLLVGNTDFTATDVNGYETRM